MHFGAEFRELVAANAPLWAGEAEIFRTYWDWRDRTQESDLCWLARQCHKEFWGGGDTRRRGLFAAPLEEMSAVFENIDRGIGRHEVLAMAAGLHQEFSHYCAFADAYDAIKNELLDKERTLADLAVELSILRKKTTGGSWER